MADRGGDSRSEGQGREEHRDQGRDEHAGSTKNYRFYEVPSRWVHELYPADEFFERQLAIPKANFGDGAGGRREGDLLARGDQRRRPGRVPERVQPENRRARVSGEVSRVVARQGDDRLAVGDGRRTDGHRRADCHGSGALLGHLAEQDAAEDLRQRDEDHRQPSDCGQAAVPSRSRHRSVDERARLPDRRSTRSRSRRSNRCTRISISSRSTSSTRSAGTRRQPASRRARQSVPDHPSIARKARRPRRGSCMPATPRRARGSTSVTRKRTRRNRRASAASSDAIDTSAPLVMRAVVGRERVSEIELQTEPKDDREAIRAADALDNLVRLHDAGSTRPSCRTTTSIASRSQSRRRTAAPATSSRRRVRRRASNVRTRVGETADADRHLGSHHQSRRVGGHRSQAGGVSGGQAPTRRDIPTAAATRRSWKSRCRRRASSSRWRRRRRSSRRSSSPAGSTRTRCRRRATSSGWRRTLVTDAAYKPILKKVNVILHPVENPDGAQMAFELAEADADSHAARRPLQRARHGRRVAGRRRIRCCRNRSCAAGCGASGCRTSTSTRTATRRTNGSSSSPATCRRRFRIYWSTRGWYTTIGGAARSALSGHGACHRRAARSHRARDQLQHRRPQHGPDDAGPLSTVGATGSDRSSTDRRSTRTRRSTTAIWRPASRAGRGALAAPRAVAAARGARR